MEEGPLLNVEAGVATITLNRPHKLNAIDHPTIDAMMRFLDLIEAEAAIRAVILTGAGDRAFSAGADIPGLAISVRTGVDVALRDFVRRGQGLTRRIENFPKPVIAAVNGLAYGGGCEIVEASALAIASEQSQFAKPEIRLGFPPPFGGTQRLPRLIGRKRALAMILGAEPISAAEAARIGLINEVVPADRLIDRARAIAHRIAGHSPLAVAACLASVTRGLNLTIDEGLAVEASHFARMVPTQDIHEGIDAFLERPARPIHRSMTKRRFGKPDALRGGLSWALRAFSLNRLALYVVEHAVDLVGDLVGSGEELFRFFPQVRCNLLVADQRGDFQPASRAVA